MIRSLADEVLDSPIRTTTAYQRSRLCIQKPVQNNCHSKRLTLVLTVTGEVAVSEYIHTYIHIPVIACME
jgi:hypothetical protein